MFTNVPRNKKYYIILWYHKSNYNSDHALAIKMVSQSNEDYSKTFYDSHESIKILAQRFTYLFYHVFCTASRCTSISFTITHSQVLLIFFQSIVVACMPTYRVDSYWPPYTYSSQLQTRENYNTNRYNCTNGKYIANM